MEENSFEESKQDLQKEYIFLIDQSGSMEGKTMELARDALMLFVKSLDYGCLFNVCSFGSKHKFMFPGNSV